MYSGPLLTTWLLLGLLDAGAGLSSSSFFGDQQHAVYHRSQHARDTWRPRAVCPSSPPRRGTTTTTTMVFDFFKDRAAEGIAQLENIATKTAQGKLGEALADTSAYVAATNEKFYDGLSKSRDQLLSNLDSLFGGDMKLEETLEQLEEVLMMADIGGTTTDEIIEDLRNIAKEDRLEPEDIKSVLRGRLIQTLEGRGGDTALSASQCGEEGTNPRAIRFATAQDENPKLTVLMVIGANGMGKTTTIGKLANRLREEAGQKVMLAACDTFRAAAVDQLEMWADRAQVEFVGPTDAAPPAAATDDTESSGGISSGGGGSAAASDEKPATVLFRALDAAVAEEVDVLIVDTSGRLSNNVQLNEELKKMKRVVEKKIGRPPHEVLLVVDASIGRNAVDQVGPRMVVALAKPMPQSSMGVRDF